MKLSLLLRSIRSTVLIATIISLLASTASFGPAYAGVAGKSIVETGPQQPGAQVTVKLQLSKPNVPVTPSVEFVIVVDTSGSLANDIAAMKSNLKTFVTNALSQYPGAVRVGITKIGNGTAAFDSNNSNNPGQNYPMYPTGSTLSSYTNVRRPNSDVGIDKVVTITSSNISQLSTAIDNIAVEPTINTTKLGGYLEQRDSANSYTSDIGPGMQSGADMFTSDNNAKYMLLLTDGLANKGFCPVSQYGNIKVPNWVTGTQLQILSSSDTTNRAGDPNGSYNSFIPQENGYPADSNFPSNYPNPNGEPGVCYPYIHQKFSATGLMADNVSPHYVSSYNGTTLPQNSMLDQMAAVYGGTKSPNIQNTFTAIINKAKMGVISITDTLNPNVFASIDAYKYLANCDSGNHYASSSTLTISGTQFTFIIQNQATITALTNICIYFSATIGPNPPPNAQPINTNSSSNVVLYQNTDASNTLATDTIDVGSITIAGSPANFVPSNFQLTDANGNVTSIFKVGDPIYIKSSVTNSGAGAAIAGAITRYYANQAAVVGPAQDPPTPNACVTHGASSAGSTYNYYSFPGGEGSGKFSTTSPCALSWSQAAVGSFTARMDVNYMQASGTTPESSYADNQATFPYATITMPTSLAVCVNASNAAIISWTAGSGITSYKIHNKNLTDGGDSYATSTTSPYSLTLPSGTKSYQVSLIPQAMVGGVLTDGPETAVVQYLSGSNTCNPPASAWFQVGGATATAAYAGDVFSNGPIGDMVMPSTPIQKYFFMPPAKGVVIGSNRIGLDASTITSTSPNPWRAADYPQTNSYQKTATYASLLTDAKRTQTPNELPAQSSLMTTNSCNGGTPGKFYTSHVAGDAKLGDTQNIAFPTTCEGVNLLYFVDGNLQISHNITDQTNSGTLTFIVQGNVTVDPAVTQLDGVYVFGGIFSDGAGSNQLVVHGSLLGLAGDQASATTGSFSLGAAQSGLQRQLTDNNQPAEQILFQPKYLYLLRNSTLGTSSFSWTE